MILPLPSSCKKRKKIAKDRPSNNAVASKNCLSSTSLARMKAALPLFLRVEAAPLDLSEEEEPLVAGLLPTALPRTHPRIPLLPLHTSNTPATAHIVREAPTLRYSKATH